MGEEMISDSYEGMEIYLAMNRDDNEALLGVRLGSAAFEHSYCDGIPSMDEVKAYCDEGFIAIAYRKENDKWLHMIVDFDNKRLSYVMAGIKPKPLKEMLSLTDSMIGHKPSWMGEYRTVAIKHWDSDMERRILSYMPKKRHAIGKPTREEVYAKCGGRCAYCGKEIAYSEMQVDHVISHYRHMGKDEIGNYLPSCRDCNGLKSDYTLDEFRTKLIPEAIKKAKDPKNGFGKNDRNHRIAKEYAKRNRRENGEIIFFFEESKTFA